MLRYFLRNAILVVALNFTVKGVYLLVVERSVQNLLPEGEYGLYFSLFNLSLLFQLLADLGLQQYNNRQLSQHRQLLTKYFPYFLGLKLLLFGGFLLALLLGGNLLKYDQETLGLLTIIGLNLGLNSLLLFLRTNLSGLGFYRLDSWVSVVDKLLMLLFIGGLILFAPDYLSVRRFALAQTLAWLLACLLLLRLLWPRLPHFRPRWRLSISWSLLRQAAPYALVVLLMTAYTRIDAVMIERLLPDGQLQADHYAAAYRLLDAANMGGFLLAGLLLPMFARLLGQGEAVGPLLGLAAPLALVAAACVSIPLMLLAQPTAQALYHFADARTGLILAWLIPSFIAVCGNYVYGSLCTAAGELKRMNQIFAVGVLLNLMGNLLVLPSYGAVGCAAITTLTQSSITIALIVLAHRRLDLSGHQLSWWRLLTFLGLYTASAWGLEQWLSLSWWQELVVLGSWGLLLAVSFRLFSFRQLSVLLSKE